MIENVYSYKQKARALNSNFLFKRFKDLTLRLTFMH